MIKKYTFNQLNKLACKGIPVIIECSNCYEDNYGLDYFSTLKKGEDYCDPEDESYQYSDGSFCGVVAYVKEMHEHIPWSWIKDVYVGEKVEVK